MRLKGAREALMDLATLVTVICAVIVSGVVVRSRVSNQQTPDALRDTSSVAVRNWQALVADGHRIGAEHPRVTILEFGDFECPACRAVEATLHSLRSRYPQTVAVVFRHWPLSYHRFAYPAARAAECASAQGKFVEYHDLLYRLQDSLGLISFDEMAHRVRIPSDRAFKDCVGRSGTVPSIERDVAAALAAGGQFTPTLIVNGHRLATVPDSARLERILQAELPTAVDASAESIGVRTSR
jgi:protein-disulfide isomerase